MAEYLADVWELLKDNKNIRSHLLDSSDKWEADRPDTQEYIRKTLPIPLLRSRWVARMHWDLIITADHARADLVDKKRCPTLRVPHGPVSISVAGSYTYGMYAFDEQDCPRYTEIFESSEYIRDTVTAANPALQGVIAVVGNLHDDEMLALAKQRDEIRSRMGFTSDDKVVMVLGAWGPKSLYNTMGDAVLEQVHALKDEFRFILNVHPHAYRPQPSGGRVWGEYLRTQREYGFIVREPDEDWMPYLVACDIILTDYTSLALRAALLDKPAVYVPIPEDDYFLSEDCPVRRLYELSPVIKEDASDLGDRLHQALDDYPLDKLKRLASQINSYPGQSRQRILKELYSLLKLPPLERLDE